MKQHQTFPRDRRDSVLAVRLTAEERAEIETRAREARICASTFIRQRLFELVGEGRQRDAVTA